MEDFDDIDGAAEALLKGWTKKDEDPKPVDETPVEDAPAEEPADEPVEDTEDEEDKEAPASLVLSDDHEVELEPGKKVKVGDLKALASREAEITAKTEAATKVEQTHAAALTKMLERAQARWEPYSKLDFMIAQKELSSEDFAALRFQANQALEDVKFYEAELESARSELMQRQQQQLQAAAQECVKVLTSDKGIKGWGPQMHQDLRAYATGNGVSPQVYDQLVDPSAYKILHKAMLYDKAQATGVKKVAAAPKNVNKTRTNGASTGSAGDAKVRDAMAKLRKSGDPEDAEAVLLARWSTE